MPAKRTITIVGGGVIGLTTAYALIQAGHDVTLIEREDNVGLQASFGNGGQLSYRYVRPLADAGVPLDAVSWMFRAGSPISLKLRPDWHQWRWLLDFLAACNARTNQKNASILLKLALRSQETLHQWQQDGLDGFLWRQPGKLVVYRNAAKFKKAAKAVTNPQQEQVLTPQECARIEPAFASLAPRLAGGIFSPDDEVADCHLFCQSLLTALQSHPSFRLLRGEARLEGRENDRCRITIDGVKHETDVIVLAAGLASRALVKPLDIALPLYGLKGYSLTVQADDAVLPTVSVTDYDNRVVYARLGNRLRLAAMVDIGALDASINPERIEHLKRLAAETLPAAGPYTSAATWAGMRPATPTGVPIIAPTQWKNLLLNVGHGALGFTLSMGSALTIRDLVEGMHS
ncbi:MAG: FAD-dependent oxidoreductase [Acetobacter indonesiensis]|jgi:D-amino-acid dehydrogenase|nr:FAD-dependent oxidoreductase [Acetobacter indonesiensis]MCI1546868.1 FAD-dependent oxidoreductase [Acetobacter indonesiensis]MCI1766220.1 FAD-dependent oxidoreductase [Acetobacter indonesiensis]